MATFPAYQPPAPAATLATIAKTGNPHVSPVLLSAAELAELQDAHGDLDIVVRMVCHFDQNSSPSFTFLHGHFADATDLSLKYIAGDFGGGVVDNRTGTYEQRSRGAVVLDGTTTPAATVSNVLAFSATLEIEIRFWDKPWLESQTHAGDTAGFAIDVMGCYCDGFYFHGGPVWNYTHTQAAAGTVPLLASLALGSNLDGSGAMDATVDQVVAHRSASFGYRPTPGGAVLGDSTDTSWLVYPPCIALARSVPAYRTGPKICILAHAGAFSDDEGASFLQWFFRSYPSLGWVVDMSGANEVIFNRGTPTTLADMQGNEAIVRANLPASPGFSLLRGLLKPGSYESSTPASKATWIDCDGPAPYNAGQILGLSGFDGFVTAHVAAIGDGASPAALQTAPVDMRGIAIASSPPIFDPVHPNVFGRTPVGQAMVASLVALGRWTT